MPPPNNYKKRQSSIIFAKGTKRYDGTNITEGANQGSTRDSQAWAGMMMGDMDSDDDSDSDRSDVDELRSRKPAPTHPPSSSANTGGSGGVRASWTTRAAAVGSRPPDTASQNPPSLKLLGLKSIKDGGIPLGSSGGSNANQPPLSPALTMRQEIERRQMEEQQRQGQQLRVEQQREAAIRNRTPSPAFEMVDEERRQMQAPPQQQRQQQQQQQQQQSQSNNLRVTSNRDYGEEAGRHGSMIDFGGTDGFGSSNKIGSQNTRGVELQDEPVRFNQQPSPERSRPQPPIQQASLGPPKDPFANQPTSPRTALTQELGLGSRSPSPYHGGQSQQRNLVSPFQDPRPSESASSGMQQQQGRNPMGPPQQQYQQRGQGNGQNGEIPLRRGPPPPLSLMPGGQGGQMNNTNNMMTVPSGPSRGGPPSPHPIPLPSPVHIPGQSNMQRNGPSPGPGPRNGGGPGGYQGMPPGPQQGGQIPPRQGFSDAPQGGPRNNPPTRRPSLFRRSKAFLTGSNVGPSQQQQQQQQQRKSLFRKSMALFTGRGNENGQMQHQNLDNGDDDSNAPAPRVQGFMDEKPKDRKSHYMGGGGMGDEWDYSGNGAKFWKRFSIAQHKLQAGDFADSEEKRIKLARRKKITMYSTLIGGLLIILAVVAVVIWRESTPTSDVPGAVDRTKGGAGTDLGQQLSSQNAASAATQTAAAASSASTSTARSAATQDDGSSSGSTGDATTTTKKKKGKHHRKNNGDTRRSIDDGDTIEDVSAIVKRQIGEIIPASPRMLSIEDARLAHATTSMIRRRRQIFEIGQE